MGFDFANKHPTEFLTISILTTSHRETKKGIDNAVTKTLRRKVNRKNKSEQELKGTQTTIEIKRYFYNFIKDFPFGVYSIALNKRKVYSRLHSTADAKSRLYNYIAKKVLDQIPFEKVNGPIELVLDKSKGGREIREFNSYIINQLQGRIDPKCRIDILHRDSDKDRVLSAADLFCWGIFRKYERNDLEWYNEYQKKILFEELYVAD